MTSPPGPTEREHGHLHLSGCAVLAWARAMDRQPFEADEYDEDEAYPQPDPYGPGPRPACTCREAAELV